MDLESAGRKAQSVGYGSQKVWSFKDLVIWKRSRELVGAVYEICKKLPKEETYGLSSQLRRAVISVPSNIAEGYRRNNRKEFANFLSIAIGSAAEVETQLLLCKDLYHINIEAEVNEVEQIQKMIASALRKLRG